MHIFIDESGIHKSVDHSTIVLVYLALENMNTIEQKIIKTEKDLKIKAFHWSDFGSRRGWGKRREFITAISRLDFSLKAAVLRNPINLSIDFSNLLPRMLIEKNIQNIIIDGKKPRRYSRQLKKILRDKGISVKKIITANDEAFPILRLADALAGLIRSYYDKPTEEAADLYGKISNKITAQIMGGQEAW